MGRKSHLRAGMLLAIILLFQIAFVQAQSSWKTPADSTRLRQLSSGFSFLIANDLGRNGFYDQKPIADMMGQVADLTSAEFVAAPGDVHHFMGVQSVNDPLWLTDYELVYNHPGLMIPWYPMLGNHEYKGNTKAIIAYSNVSRRWQMPARYYSKTFNISDSVRMLLLFIDTTPMIDKYRADKESGASGQDYAKQLKWIDSTLSHSHAKWKIVLGHHPVYAATLKVESEQADLQKRLKPFLEKNGTDMYICGHIHYFEHFRFAGSSTDYIVNTSGSMNRSPLQDSRMIFGSQETGFLVCTAENKEVLISLVNKDGKIVYQYSKRK
jgi:3',5'-cyclic AMP phosphodiesterase CpdA